MAAESRIKCVDCGSWFRPIDEEKDCPKCAKKAIKQLQERAVQIMANPIKTLSDSQKRARITELGNIIHIEELKIKEVKKEFADLIKEYFKLNFK